EYSPMTGFAGLGYDAWTMDHENYGRSSRTHGNSDIASGVADLVAATELAIRETGQERLHFMGESSGALRAAAFAMARPERVGRIVLRSEERRVGKACSARLSVCSCINKIARCRSLRRCAS